MAFLKIVAGVLGLPFDSLYQREKRRQRRRWLAQSAAALAICGIMDGLWWWKQSQIEAHDTQAHQSLSQEQARKWAEQGREHLLRDEWARAAAYLSEAEKVLRDDPDVEFMNRLALESFRGQMMALEGLSEPVCKVAWSSDGKLIAAGDQSGHVLWWDAMTGTRRGSSQITTVTHAPVGSLIFVPKTDLLVAASGIPNMECSGALVLLHTSAKDGKPTTLDGNADGTVVAVSNDGRLLSSPTLRYTPQAVRSVRVWSLPDGNPAKAFSPEGLVKAWPADGKRLAACSNDGSVNILGPSKWPKSSSEIGSPQRHALPVSR